jgi:Zn-finger nucleic acid-binding protein
MLDECGSCGGLFVDHASLEQICASRELKAVVVTLGVAPPNRAVAADTVRYLPCPTCGELMNRRNFGRVSGVLVDVCKPHGTWFDRDELRRAIAFVQAGGLEVQRAREREELAAARRSPPVRLPDGSLGTWPGELRHDAVTRVLEVLRTLFS